MDALVGVDHVGRDRDELLEAGAEGVPEAEHLWLRHRRVKQGLRNCVQLTLTQPLNHFIWTAVSKP